MMETPITEVQTGRGYRLEDIKGHAPFSSRGQTGGVLVVRPEHEWCDWHKTEEIGEFALTLWAEDINYVDVLWSEKTEFLEVVGSVSAIVEALCEEVVDPRYDDDVAVSKARALAWAEHLESVAQTIRSRVGGAA